MSIGALAAQKLYHGARRLVHPLVDSFLPVTYTAEKVLTRKRRLDPTGARSKREDNEESRGRILRLVAALGIEKRQAEGFLEEAERVRYIPVPKSDRPDLTPPMCWEDRYATYVITRATTPGVAVETGIAHGISSAYILAAMQTTGQGSLTSIEIIDDDPRIGQAVPAELRSRWIVRFGSSLDVLPEVLADCGLIDMFVHDSRHDYPHVWREFELVWSHLRPGGILCAHDILENNAFPRFVSKHRHEIDAWASSVNFGLVRRRRAPHAKGSWPQETQFAAEAGE
ncbi:MAG: class I SAM-dependent methyltransferase [Phycisphaerae bacterium]